MSQCGSQEKFRSQPEKSTGYAEAWLKKAQKEKDWFQTTLAYRHLMFISEKALRDQYSDSVLIAALKSKDNGLIGSAYLTKGILFYDKKDFNNALKNYIQANQYLILTQDKYSIYKLKYAIAQTKFYLGLYHEAIALYEECLHYFENENDRAYLNTVHSLALCYNKINDYERASKWINHGQSTAKQWNIYEMNVYFYHAEGINNFYLRKFKNSMELLERSIPELKTKEDFASLTIAHFYLAKNHWELNEKGKALVYLKKVDSTFTKTKYIRPDLRENFELLINYYKEKKDNENHLKYVLKLLEIDSLNHANYKYISKKIFKEYDKEKLLFEKKQLENNLKMDKTKYGIALLLLTLLYTTIMYINKQKQYKKKFEALMSKTETTSKTNAPVSLQKYQGKELDINPNIVEGIINRLEKFETSDKILQKDLTLIKLAGYLNTNTKYASKVIVHVKGKKSNEYINELKINYILNKLKTESKYRNYTNKALSDEAGFGSVQNFTKAFKNQTGLSPTYFIQELNKTQTSNTSP